MARTYFYMVILLFMHINNKLNSNIIIIIYADFIKRRNLYNDYFLIIYNVINDRNSIFEIIKSIKSIK